MARLSAAAVMLALAPATSAKMIDPPDKRQGITNAKAKGMKIDPAAEPLMERAPLGTCANDPTLPKCPPARAVVFLDSEGYADDEAPVARAAIDQCRLRVTDQSPYKAVGLAQMDAQNYCSAAVTTHEMYGVLRKFYAGQWYAVASRHKAGGIPGTTIHVSVRYDCTAPLQ